MPVAAGPRGENTGPLSIRPGLITPVADGLQGVRLRTLGLHGSSAVAFFFLGRGGTCRNTSFKALPLLGAASEAEDECPP
jgi:hypothetical protein